MVDYSRAGLELETVKRLMFFLKVNDKLENDEFIENINVIKKNRMKLVNMKEMDFDDTRYRNKKKFEQTAESLFKKINKVLDVELAKRNLVILHSHNLNLGFNPILSRALGKLSEDAERRRRPLIILYHIHEFAEENHISRIEFVKTCAGKKVEKSFTSNILYPQGKHILYAATSSFHAKLLKELGIEQVMVLPNSINVKLYSKKPIFRLNNFNLNKLRIERIDFKEDIIQKIEKYANHKNYFFDRNRKIILLPVTLAPDKNVFEALLLLKLLNSIKDEWQLLITHHALREKDKEYQNLVIDYIKKYRLPCTVGFGPDIISSKSDRNVIDGIVFQYVPTDVFGLSQAILTTSIREETQKSFLEGWLSSTKIFGRKIPEIVQDLERNGMNMKHLYDRILIRSESIQHFKQRMTKSYAEHINLMRKEQRLPVLKEADVWNKVILQHICVKKGKQLFVDFAHLPAKMQLEVLEQHPLDELMLNNPHLRKLLGFVDKKNIKVINTNRKVIIKKYSIKSKKEELKKIISGAVKTFSSKKRKIKVKDNAKILAYFTSPQRVRIIE